MTVNKQVTATRVLLVAAAIAGAVAGFVLQRAFPFSSEELPGWCFPLLAAVAAVIGAWSVRASVNLAAADRGPLAVAIWSGVGVIVAHFAFAAMLTVLSLVRVRQTPQELWEGMLYGFIAMPFYSLWLTLPLGISCGLLMRVVMRRAVRRAALGTPGGPPS